jgi:F0F1-type ATP synthase assembly protein I
MFDGLDPKEMGRYFALGQVGMEMVLPIGVGLVLDHYLGCTPWLAVAGAVLGFTAGLAHLIYLVNKMQDGGGSPGEGRGKS